MSGKRNRNAGNSYERKIKNELNKLFNGSDYRTTREVSRFKDAKGIDLIDINGKGWFSVQCKNTVNFPKLDGINFVTDEGYPNILFWKRTKNVNGRFMPRGEYVVMKKEDFYELLEKCRRCCNDR